MTFVLAAIDDSDVATTVLAVARTLAEQLQLGVRAIHVREGPSSAAAATADRAGVELEQLEGDPVDAIVDAVAAPDVILAVVGARGAPAGPRPCGHVALAVVERVDKAVVVVPPALRRDPAAPIHRVVIPLEGTEATSAAIATAVRCLEPARVDVTAVHVFDDATVPRFRDRSMYADESFATEFAARWCADPAVPVRLRRGDVGTAALDVARDEDADLIALGWSQDLSPGRARTVHAVLERSQLPVLLVPLAQPEMSTPNTSRKRAT